MRAVVQRVTRASVKVDGKVIGEIGNGLVILVGIARDDTKVKRLTWSIRFRTCASLMTMKAK